MMLCRNPYTSGATAYPCGQCMPCRLNRRRIWTQRICLEALQNKDNTFATLTYSDDKIPLKNEVFTLNPDDLTNFMKRLRRNIHPEKVRYYGVGEYGESSFRPHYHVALFGFPNCRRGMSYYPRVGSHCCAICDIVKDTWGNGNILLGELNQKTAQYIAGYVTKKMTKEDDPRLGGRYPEFARMSLRPGVGYTALHEIASELMTYGYDQTEKDVPTGLRHGLSVLPLGRYLRGKLRALVGQDENTPESVLDEIAAQLRPMYEAAFSTPRAPGTRKNFFRTLLLEDGAAQFAQIEARNRIYRERRSL